MADTAQENEAVIRRGYELFNSANMAGLAEIFQEDAVWHVAGRGRLAGEKRGRDATFAYFAELGQGSRGTFRAEMHDVIANGEHVAGIHTSTGQREGRQLTLHTVLLFHLRDGKITEGWEHLEDSQAFDEFFA